MYQENNTIYHAQSLFIQWMACFNNRRYEQIKSACENLCDIIGKEKEYALHNIFYPLFRSGVIEFIENGCYTLSTPVLITGKENHCILINHNPVGESLVKPTTNPAIYYSENAATLKATFKDSTKTYKFELNTILKKFPNISDIVETFEKSPLMKPGKPEKAKLIKQKNGFTYQLDNYHQHITYNVPEQNQNPDAVNLAGYYERILCEISNGHYNGDNKQLKLLVKRIPFILYRVLFIHTLLAGHTVGKEKDMYVFSDIPYAAYRELNRILSNSITTQS